MIDWFSSMQQSFEFYRVDPETWKDVDRIENVDSCTINRDSENETLGSATIDCDLVMEEEYIRVYLIAVQNGSTHKEPLGTFLVQTPSISFDGKTKSISMDAYTPLIELKNNVPPIGYAILKNQPIMDMASRLCRENMRAPVVPAKSEKNLYSDFVSNSDDSWLTFIIDLISNAEYELSLDELGRLLFEPVQDIAALQPVQVFDDGNSSILYPNIKDERDLYGIPNVVEVLYSSNNEYIFSRVVNDDENSVISTVNRGREAVHRETNPSVTGIPDQEYMDEYATQLLRNLSCLEHTITYTHGYCPVRIGDCVMLNYERAGITNVKAKVISQNIKCQTGCPVEETAVYTTKLWR